MSPLYKMLTRASVVRRRQVFIGLYIAYD